MVIGGRVCTCDVPRVRKLRFERSEAFQMRAAWYQKQGPARDVWWSARCRTLIPGLARCAFRIAASGINPAISRNARIHLGWECPIPALSRTAMAPGRLTRSVMACHRNGSVDECGVTAHNPIAHSEQRQSLQWFRCIMSLPCRIACRRKRAHALAFPASQLRAVHVGGEVAGRTVLV
jgi:hypothetical protein